MTDVSIILEVMQAASDHRRIQLAPDDWKRFDRLLRDMRTASVNSACERFTAEFRDDGSLILLTR